MPDQHYQNAIQPFYGEQAGTHGDIAAYDRVHDEILGMAGMLSEGIMMQFPDKFK